MYSTNTVFVVLCVTLQSRHCAGPTSVLLEQSSSAEYVGIAGRVSVLGVGGGRTRERVTLSVLGVGSGRLLVLDLFWGVGPGRDLTSGITWRQTI